MKRLLPLVLFLLSLGAYNLNCRSLSSGDTIPSSVLPFCILTEHTLTLDRYYQLYQDMFFGSPYFFTKSRGHVYSSYPVAVPLLITPLYVPVVAGLGMGDWPAERVAVIARGMEKISASLVAALSATLFFLLLRRVAPLRTAVVLALLFALGTETWTISSQALWQHGPGVLMIVSSLLAFRSAAVDLHRPMPCFWAGLFAALACSMRPTNALFLFACITYMLIARWRFSRLVLFSLCPALIGVAVCCYNYQVFGDIRGFREYQNCWDPFSSQVFWRLAGLLVSPSRGLFVYTPVLLFLPLGIGAWIRAGRPERPLYVVSLLFSGAQLLLIASCRFWVGGWCYGPRYLTELSPCLVLLLVPAVPLVARRTMLKILFGLTLALSILIQGVGAFCWGLGAWDSTPVDILQWPDRVWDWRDSQIIREAFSGGIDRSGLRHLFQPLPKTLLSWTGGFSYLEGNGAHHWRWCAAQGELVLTNVSPKDVTLVLEMACTTGYPVFADLQLESPWFSEHLQINIQPRYFQKTVTLSPGRHVLHFTCNAPRVKAVGDVRDLVFRVVGFDARVQR